MQQLERARNAVSAAMLLPVAAMLWPALSDPDAPGPPFILSWLFCGDYLLRRSYGTRQMIKVLGLRDVQTPGAYWSFLRWFRRCSSFQLLMLRLWAESGCWLWCRC